MSTAAAADSLKELRAAYLHLMKRTLTDTIHHHTCSMNGSSITIHKLDPEHLRWVGEDWPALAETMIGLKRMDAVQACVETVLAEDVPGDLIETGVWRGGTCVFMRAILRAYGVTDREIYVADSFEGLPPPDETKYPQDAGMTLHEVGYLRVSMDQVADSFSRYGLLDDKVNFVKGFFRDTLPQLREKRWAVVRLDGDMYESTMDGLVNLYPNLSVGGFLLLDDYYHIPASAAATEDYRARHNITEPIVRVDNYSGLWRKTAPMDEAPH